MWTTLYCHYIYIYACSAHKLDTSHCCCCPDLQEKAGRLRALHRELTALTSTLDNQLHEKELVTEELDHTHHNIAKEQECEWKYCSSLKLMFFVVVIHYGCGVGVEMVKYFSPFQKLGSPDLVNATAATKEQCYAFLPVCAVFLCVQTVAWLFLQHAHRCWCRQLYMGAAWTP